MTLRKCLQNQSHLIVLTLVLLKEMKKTDPMMLIGNVIHLPYHQTCLKTQVATGKKERNIL